MAKRKNNTVTPIDPATLDTYFKQRMYALGITNTADHFFRVEVDFPGTSYNQAIFTEDHHGNIEIYYPCIYGGPETIGNTERPFKRIRLKPENMFNPEIKYYQEKDSGVHIFFPPAVIDRIKNKTPEKTGYIIEGEFKAFAGALHGLNMVGLGGKDLFTDGEKRLHPDILAWIRACDIQNLVLVLDADVFEVTWNFEDEPNKDLAKRLNSFCKTVIKFREYAKGEVRDCYFMHIKDTHLSRAKGLDDLIQVVKTEGDGYEKMILEDIARLASAKNYFDCINLGDQTAFKLRALFGLNLLKGVPVMFYHLNEDLIKDRVFNFNNAHYQYNKNSYQLELVKHEDSFKFIRIGCDFFKNINVPNAKGVLMRRLEPWKSGEISRDYVNAGFKNFFDTIDKYDAACNVPCHTADYKAVIDGCFNMYYPLDHELEAGPWPNTEAFLKHIFGEKKLPSGFTNYELGLDYITLLYQQPTQRLPILALVNRMRGTGKSTFLWFLEALFQSNYTEIGNEELKDHLNDDWASKLIVGIDEGFIEKRTVVERLKSMSTAHTIKLRGMYAGRKSMPFFAKFVISSNDEDNFAPIGEEENRFWVNKVPVLTKDDPHMLEKLTNEVPAFLHYLSTRAVLHPNTGRHWFSYNLLDTEAGQKVKENSKGWLYSDLKAQLTDKFIHYQWPTLYYSLDEVCKILNGPTGLGKYKPFDIQRTLKDKFNLEPKLQRYQFPNEPESQAAPLGKTHSRGPARAYEFRIENFISEEELRSETFTEFFRYEEIILSRQKATIDLEPKLPFA